MSWADYQTDIYRRGRETGQLPRWSCNMLDLERTAIAELDPDARGYIAASAGDSRTAARNRSAFDEWSIVPRMLRGVASPDTRTTVAGSPFAAPLGLASVGVQTLAHPNGEVATARAAARTGVPYSHSQAAAFSFEEVADGAPGAETWFQLYWVRDPETVSSFLQRAKRSGATSLVLTVDTPLLGWRPTDLDRSFLPFSQGIGIANYTSDPGYMERAATAFPGREDAAARYWEKTFPHPSLDWAEVATLRARWEGPLYLKGVLHPDDALRALDMGFDGLIVSNHGGRQIDGSMAALHALPRIRRAVGLEPAVLVDSGIRTGTDLFTAIALGADMGMIGRAFLYGLALGGEEGVEHVIRSILAEFALTMMLAGTPTVADITSDTVMRHGDLVTTEV